MMHRSLSLKKLTQIFLSIKTEDQMIDFLKGLLTPQELDQLPVRVELIKKLKQGQSQRQIAQELNVGIATVTRGAHEIKKGRFKNVK